MNAVLAFLLRTPFGRKLTLLIAGMASVLTPVAVYVNADAIRANLPRLAAFAGMREEPAEPRLVTFGPLARVNEGDHDFRQLIRFSVPADAGTVHVRVFDPDTGGSLDEPKGGFGSTFSFSLYGAGADVRFGRDGDGVVQENVSGEPLGTVEFGRDDAADGRWVTLFPADASNGIEADGGRRAFVLLVEGVSGNDGNVFDVALSTEPDRNRPPVGARLYTYLPTFQVPAGRDLAELRFTVPDDAKALSIENFDAAGGRLTYGGRFRSAGLAASGKSEWRRTQVLLDADEPGSPGSVTANSGGETPNDLTVFVGAVTGSGDDAALTPVAIELPVRAVAPNRHPQIALAVEPLACRQMRFDASASSDPDGDPLTLRWRFDADGAWSEGAALERTFETYGVHPARLEVYDASGTVASGAARDFSFFVKPPPVAAFTAPDLVAEGADVRFDGTASTSPSLPQATQIARYRWDFGDGTVLEQEAGDADFGRPAHRYATFGTYTVELTVTDSSGNPCNQATATKTIAVNAPPAANAGGDRRIALGETVSFDAGPPQGADGDTHGFSWDFGDGSPATGATVLHRFDRPGTYTVTLTADDGRGAANSVASDEAQIFVNAAPVADAIATPDRMVAGAPGIFDASTASDPDGRIAAVAWTFGDGTSAERPVVRHSFAAPGTYQVTVSITDDSTLANGTTTLERTVTVVESGNEQPVADGGGDREAVVGEVLTFDGAASHDPDGSILSLAWDFGDGTTASGIAADHVYRTAGTYRATLSVVDGSGRENGTAETAFDVIVANRANLSPEVRVGGDRAAFVDEILEFDATGTVDPDGNVVAIDWDFGDGARASGFRAMHAYAAPGQYEVHVLVRDDSGRRGAESDARFTVSVTHPYNRAPDADVEDELALETGVPHLFGARSAHDPDGLVTRLRWDFGDRTGTDEAVIEHAYATPGTYFGKLTLIDDFGARERHHRAEVRRLRRGAPERAAGSGGRRGRLGDRRRADRLRRRGFHRSRRQPDRLWLGLRQRQAGRGGEAHDRLFRAGHLRGDADGHRQFRTGQRAGQRQADRHRPRRTERYAGGPCRGEQAGGDRRAGSLHGRSIGRRRRQHPVL